MWWLRLAGSLKLQVSFAKEPYHRDDIQQKRPTIFRSLLFIATLYVIQNIESRRTSTQEIEMSKMFSNWSNRILYRSEITFVWSMFFFDAAAAKWSHDSLCPKCWPLHVSWVCILLQHAATHSATRCNTLCNTLQYTARHCHTLQRNTLQHTATHCNALQYTSMHCNTQFTMSQMLATPCFVSVHTTATRCNTHCNTLQHDVTHCNAQQHTATHFNALQHTAAHCSALQHTATQLSMLHI